MEKAWFVGLGTKPPRRKQVLNLVALHCHGYRQSHMAYGLGMIVAMTKRIHC